MGMSLDTWVTSPTGGIGVESVGSVVGVGEKIWAPGQNDREIYSKSREGLCRGVDRVSVLEM
jgi:hypothetical protein